MGRLSAVWEIKSPGVKKTRAKHKGLQTVVGRPSSGGLNDVFLKSFTARLAFFFHVISGTTV